MGLLDQLGSFGQGLSNAQAGIVSGPVDGLAWLLRKAGVPIPPNPMGGSDWMAEKGFTQVPQERMAGLLGEGIGGALPAVIGAKAPQIAGGLLKMEANAAIPQTLSKQAGVIGYPRSKALATAQKNAEEMLGLPANNTAMDRAKALGFDVEYNALHGTAANTNFKKFKTGVGGFDELGAGTYFTDQPLYANTWANAEKGRVIPSVVKGGDLYDKSNPIDYLQLAKRLKANNIPMSTDASMIAPIDDLWKTWLSSSDKDFAANIKASSKGGGINTWLERAGYKGAMTTGHQQIPGQRVIFNPADIRSRFAAFDPAKIKDADLLGRADPALLGLLGIGAGGAAYGMRDK